MTIAFGIRIDYGICTKGALIHHSRVKYNVDIYEGTTHFERGISSTMNSLPNVRWLAIWHWKIRFEWKLLEVHSWENHPTVRFSSYAC